jgi:hypothetical protein
MRGPLVEALIQKQSDAVVLQLINGKADVNEQDGAGYTPLILAAQQDRRVIISQLICNGALLETCTTWGMSALFYVRRAHRSETAELLLRAGAKWRDMTTPWMTTVPEYYLKTHKETVAFVARIERRVTCCRSAVAALLRILRPKDVARLVAKRLWETRVWDDWER